MKDFLKKLGKWKEGISKRLIRKRFFSEMIKWKDIPIRRKLFLSLGFNSMLFLLLTAFTIFLFQNIRTDIQHVNEKGEQAVAVSEIGSLIRSKDIRIADYITFLRDEDVKGYRKVRNELNQKTQILKDQVTEQRIEKMISDVQKNNSEIDRLFINKVAPSVVRLDKEIYTEARADISELRDRNVKILSEMENIFKNERQSTTDSMSDGMRIFLYLISLSALIGTIVSATIVFFVANSLNYTLKELAEKTKLVAKGKLGKGEITYQGKDEMGQLAGSVNFMMTNLTDMVSGIRSVSYSMEEDSRLLRNYCYNIKLSSSQISATMSELSAGAQEQSAATQELLGKYDLFSEQIESSAVRGNELKHLSMNVKQLTHSGYESMQESVDYIELVWRMVKNTYDEVKEMERQTQNISQLTEVIQSIAAQTHILALNAAIEAARAGEAGKGFMVVANEVRKLANGVEQSLQEINVIVSSVQTVSKNVKESLEHGYQKLEEGQKKIHQTGKGLTEIKTEVDKISGAIEEISNKLDDVGKTNFNVRESLSAIAGNSNQVTAATMDNFSSSQMQDAEIEGIFEKSDHIARQSKDLASLVGKFEIEGSPVPNPAIEAQ
ncbi:methyl-accepting chemotaxis protein [Mesobacillus subterraneus]|uniref:Methyl-accepting chemotaxis protein n=1 Tax=Mesobacillus subterraneus TaxID=285983 RepID=A0A0D6ZBC3_9BACI|nr:methyl-accepting chemotaxis protein [Mesobacillus subterraneus]KIY22326.1 hypothetical protein UB32_09180 [Mesobacillus subterraneus]